jgi:collagen type I alpha
VRWVGYRDIAVSAHSMPEKVRPIWIRANARGPGVPKRDLLLSPDHAIFIDGVLIPAGLLVNGVSILPAYDVPRPRYWHVELDAHDILFAEGLTVESFLDTGQRNGFTDGSGVVMLGPGFSPARVAEIWETLAAALLILHGPRLQAVRSQLAANIGTQDTTYDVAV